MDGNVKTKTELKEGYKYIMPSVSQPGYPEDWYRRIVEDAGEKLKALPAPVIEPVGVKLKSSVGSGH